MKKASAGGNGANCLCGWRVSRGGIFSFVLHRIFPRGTNVLREPKVLLVPPLRLLYRPFDEVSGGLREDFFALAMRQAGLSPHYLKSTRGQKTPDFLIDHAGQRLVFEIGGRGKGRSQFKGITADRKLVLAPDLPPTADQLPIHLLGLLSGEERTAAPF